MNRYYCQVCKAERCRLCLASPYHAGYTCEGYKKLMSQKRCRTCDKPVDEGGQCSSEDCRNIAKEFCSRQLACGHQCNGFSGEKACLPCLVPDCAAKHPELRGVNCKSLCNICMASELEAEPVVRGRCGHFFHAGCVKHRL